MTELVYLAPNTREPYTTSEIIADCAQVAHHAVQQMISRYENDFRAFGLLAFEMRAVERARGVKYAKIYHAGHEASNHIPHRHLRESLRKRIFHCLLFRKNQLIIFLRCVQNPHLNRLSH